ncbi:MAG: 30S ribosomal protein S1 [Spirochaetia bacterium]
MSDNHNISEDQFSDYLTIFEKKDEGSTLEGIVVQVDKEFVYLDVGMKSEGRVPIADFDEIPEIGSAVTCVLLNQEGKNGEVVVSKRRADSKVLVKKLVDAFEKKEPVQGKIAKIVKGGFEVDLGAGIRAFLPLSRADIARVEDPAPYIGVKSLFFLERLYEKNKINPVVNRRDYLQEVADVARTKFFETVGVGDIVEGTVKSFSSFGAFIDLGGFDGLLHLNDMSWGHATRPKDYAKKDEKIKLKVIRLDPENKKINLGLKHFQEDPWVGFEKRYHLNDIVEGHVTKLADFGAFVEIEEGIEGLVHVSELSWVKRVKHPQEVINIGEKVKVCILGYDTSEERISLGLKQTMENPWDDIMKKYPEGQKIQRPIKKITGAGMFIELEEGIDGFLHVDDMSWNKRVQNLSAQYQPGDSIEVVVVRISPEEHRISLGLKQLQENPWDEMLGFQHRGEALETEVISKTDFGIFVRVPNGIEGLIHKSNLVDPENGSPDEALAAINVGDKIVATVISVIPDKKRLALSVKDHLYKQEHADMGQYLSKSGADDEKYTLADVMKDEE